jgi:8-oxo-dGTP pyrophosphatase MutT (NUDIX family)
VDIRVLPPRALDRALAFARDRPVVSEPRDSASVLLVRDGGERPEICTIRRHHTMATAGGVLVFPGGLVDPQDIDGETPWAAGDSARWAAVLGLGEVAARAVVTTAVRELFEETGVLLAGGSADDVAAQPPDGWRDERARLEAHELGFADFLAAHGWGVRADLLRLWSTWLTPEFESRRYRARFFVAALPAGQAAYDGSTESTGLRWDTAAALLEGARDGRHQLLAPQYCLSLELDGFATVEGVLGATTGRARPLVEPRLETVDGVPRLLLPPDLLALAQLG